MPTSLWGMPTHLQGPVAQPETAKKENKMWMTSAGQFVHTGTEYQFEMSISVISDHLMLEFRVLCTNCIFYHANWARTSTSTRSSCRRGNEAVWLPPRPPYVSMSRCSPCPLWLRHHFVDEWYLWVFRCGKVRADYLVSKINKDKHWAGADLDFVKQQLKAKKVFTIPFFISLLDTRSRTHINLKQLSKKCKIQEL